MRFVPDWTKLTEVTLLLKSLPAMQYNLIRDFIRKEQSAVTPSNSDWAFRVLSNIPVLLVPLVLRTHNEQVIYWLW